MKLYPLFLNLKGKPCVVIGGGKVAERKVLSLIDTGARVLVISPKLTPLLTSLLSKRRISHRSRTYEKGDLEGVCLAVSATNSKRINEAVSNEARERRVFLNVVDIPRLCDFYVPAVLEQGDLLIAISTSGKSPALAKKIRKELEKQYGWEYGPFLELMGAIRLRLLTKSHDKPYNKKLLSKIISSNILYYLKEGKEDEINGILQEVLDDEFSLSELNVSITSKR
jgi:precorrin-2 dehydrogenase/sirohydrochlorin ferrochelatase